MYLSDVVNMQELAENIKQGYVSISFHPTLPLTVINYTKRAQFEQHWNEVTEICRGLIVDDSDRIIAMPFKKFYSYDDPRFPLDTSGPVEVYDKLDGSLGIVCFYDNELVVATRGSFVSDMALWAYDFIKNNYYSAFRTLCSGGISTALVEIIYPENRIVVDYKGMQDVVLLGAHNHRWAWISPDRVLEWPGRKAESFSASTFEQALALPPRENAEGVVVYFKNTGQRVKIKQADYIELHRAIFNISQLNVWRQIMQGNLRNYIDSIPDEFDDYVRNTANQLLDQARSLMQEVAWNWFTIRRELESDYTSREFHELALDYKHGRWIEMIEKNRLEELNDKIWRSIRPHGKAM